MLILFCISLIGGAVLFHSGSFSLGGIGFLALLWGVLFCFMLRRRRSYVLGIALACTVVLGALRMWMIPVHEVSLGNQAFVGTVKSVDARLDKTLLVVKKDDSDEVVQVTLRDKPSTLPGDNVSVRGIVELPKDFVTDTGRTFEYDQYLARRGVDAVMNRGQVVKLHESGFSFTRIATTIRFWIAGLLASHIVFPVDGIVAGMLVGFQGGIPSYLSDIFRPTGTLHTLVLSGYNITVLAVSWFRIASSTVSSEDTSDRIWYCDTCAYLRCRRRSSTRGDHGNSRTFCIDDITRLQRTSCTYSFSGAILFCFTRDVVC